MKYFHYQLVEGGQWFKELGYSLANVMAHVATFDTVPFSYFTTPY